MDAKEDVFDDLHRLSCERDRRQANLVEIQRAIKGLEQQLHAKQMEMQDNVNTKVNLEVKILKLAQSIVLQGVK
jgi:Skp family chaperone for outer membrane proteins